MNLAPVHVENAHGYGARRLVDVGDKLGRSNRASRVGEQFADDVG